MSDIRNELNDYYGMDASLPSHPEAFKEAATTITAADQAFLDDLAAHSALARVDGITQSDVNLCEPITESATLLTRVRKHAALAHTATATVAPLQVRAATYNDRNFTRSIDTEVHFPEEEQFYSLPSTLYTSIRRRTIEMRDPASLQEYHTKLANDTDDPRVLGTFEDKNKLSGEDAKRRRTFMLTRRAIQDSLRGPVTAIADEDGRVVPLENNRPRITAEQAGRVQTAVLSELGLVDHQFSPLTNLQIESGLKPAPQTPTGKFEITSLPKVG